MVGQDNGWPLGLENVDIRVKIVDALKNVERNPVHLASSSLSSFSSSDLDTESTASFLPDRSITLGNLMGITPCQRRSRFAGNEQKYPAAAPPPEMNSSSNGSRRISNNNRSSSKGRSSWRFLIWCMQKKDPGQTVDGPTLADLLQMHRAGDRASSLVFELKNKNKNKKASEEIRSFSSADEAAVSSSLKIKKPPRRSDPSLLQMKLL